MVAAKKGGPARRKTPQDGILYLRVPVELLELLDAWVEERRAARHGLNATRSDLVREVLYEAALARKKPAKGRGR
jgi:hypothetical protein